MNTNAISIITYKALQFWIRSRDYKNWKNLRNTAAR